MLLQSTETYAIIWHVVRQCAGQIEFENTTTTIKTASADGNFLQDDRATG